MIVLWFYAYKYKVWSHHFMRNNMIKPVYFSLFHDARKSVDVLSLNKHSKYTSDNKADIVCNNTITKYQLKMYMYEVFEVSTINCYYNFPNKIITIF